MPYSVCIQLEPVSSTYPVIFQLLKEVNKRPCPTRLTQNTHYWNRYIHDWRRHEFMPTIDSCHWDRPCVLIHISSERNRHIYKYPPCIETKVSRLHYRKASISSKLHVWSFISRPQKLVFVFGHLKCLNGRSNMASSYRSFLLIELAMTLTIDFQRLTTIKYPNSLHLFSWFWTVYLLFHAQAIKLFFSLNATWFCYRMQRHS